jgi:hypothetical protein
MAPQLRKLRRAASVTERTRRRATPVRERARAWRRASAFARGFGGPPEPWRRWSALRGGAALATTLLLVLAWPDAAVAANDEQPQLTGSWVLNKDLSADPAGTLEAPRPRGGGRMPIGGQGGGIGGPVGGGVGGPIIGGRGGGFERPDPDESARMREALRMLLDSPEQIIITTQNRTVVITSRDGRVQHLRADGKKVDETTDGGLRLERKTKWDDDELVSEFKVKDSGGGKVKQTWKRDGARLVVTSEIESPRAAEPLIVRRVYDPEEGS